MFERHAVIALALFACTVGAACTADADPAVTLEPGLDAEQVIFFEDFEHEDYKARWKTHWNKPVGAGTVTADTGDVFAGERSAFLQGLQGEHKSRGEGEYVLETPLDVVFMRLYLRLDDDFDLASANGLKLFGIRGGVDLDASYGGAGARAKGDDKFSARVTLDREHNLNVYTYHPDQPKRFGERFHGKKRRKLDPGRWQCMELMVRANTPGEKDGEIRLWRDDKEIVKANKVRFRDIEELKIRRVAVGFYFGGAGKQNTSPKDQRLYIDNLVISRERIGCGPSQTPE